MFHMFMFGKYLSTCDQIEGKNMHLMSQVLEHIYVGVWKGG